MFSRRQEVGKVAKHVSSTKMSAQPWSRQSLNIFAAAAPAPEEEPAPEGGENGQQQQQQQQQQQHRSGENNIFEKPSTRVHAAPGGRSSVGALMAYDPAAAVADEPAAAAPQERRPSAVASLLQQEQQERQPEGAEEARERSSSRVLSVPGGASSMGGIITGTAAASPVPAPRHAAPSASLNIFSAPADAGAARPSTRRIAVPGGSSGMQQMMAHQCEPEAAHGIRTGKTNVSSHVVNLTPAPARRQTARTARINEECKEADAEEGEVPQQQQQLCFASRQAQKALASNIFAFAAGEDDAVADEGAAAAAPAAAPQQGEDATLHGTGKPSTKVHCAPGGASQGLW